MKLTLEEKFQMFRKGQYKMPVPPVLHVSWSEKSWVEWIDKHGFWKKPVEKEVSR